ncbi:MAG: hypothetical protein HPY55_06535 [Firmicutes bacterium]|nr:hypothetical protein [Bacillota bacterium]
MPVTEPFTEIVSVYVAGAWAAIPAQGLKIEDSTKSRVSAFSFSVVKTPDVPDEVWNALTLNARVKVFQQVGTAIDEFTGTVVTKPRKRLEGVPVLELSCVDDTILASHYRFIDSWPKQDVQTASDIVIDAWTRYGPASVSLASVGVCSKRIGAISSNLDTLFDFMEEICRRTGWAWRIRNDALEFWDPQRSVFGTVLDEEMNIVPDSLVITEEMPQVANVVFVPAKVRDTDFEDLQASKAGQAQYMLQYQPLIRQFQAGGQTVYLDAPPQVYLGGVEQTVAEDGSADAATAQVVYNVENRFIRFAVAPAVDGQEVKAVYTAEMPVIVRREDAGSIALFGERHEKVVKDPRPVRAEAEQIADAFLRERAYPIRPVGMGITAFGLRSGMYAQVRIPSEGIDHLMPCVSVTRETAGGQLHITVTLNQAPVTDEDAVFDLFQRVNRLEAKETSRNQRIERYMDVSDDWGWAGEVIYVRHACPIPSEDLYPSEELLPC